MAAKGKKEGGKVNQVSGAPLGSSGCKANACKGKNQRFGFCDVHFEQFKFGLINKAGAEVPDYEKKLGHYEAFKQRKTVQKVA